jgi:Lon protease-like protein
VAVLPMFPLGSVLLPGAVLPLHVFEPRYRQLVKDCLAGEPEFGVTLISRGHEVGGGDQRTDAGSVARMVQVGELPDGRYALLTVGVRRIRVVEWLPDDPYPQAEVDDWPDEEPDALASSGLAELTADTHRAVRRVVALAVELGDTTADPGVELTDDPVLASYQLCALAPVGPADRQRLLCALGPADRLRLLGELLGDVEDALRFRLS